MSKLSMTSFVTLDGVMQAPGGPREDTSGGFTHGGWFIPLADAAFGEFIVGVFARAGRSSSAAGRTRSSRRTGRGSPIPRTRSPVR